MTLHFHCITTMFNVVAFSRRLTSKLWLTFCEQFRQSVSCSVMSVPFLDPLEWRGTSEAHVPVKGRRPLLNACLFHDRRVSQCILPASGALEVKEEENGEWRVGGLADRLVGELVA